MKPVEFPGQNSVYAKNQPPYLPLPVLKMPDGMVISCWHLTWRERLRVLVTGDVWSMVRTFNSPLQPQRLTTKAPFRAVA
jgi:hypothetical protein